MILVLYQINNLNLNTIILLLMSAEFSVSMNSCSEISESVVLSCKSLSSENNVHCIVGKESYFINIRSSI